ncbi:MAG: Lipoyl synthase [Candidatus Ordinivivax streblomastigis]|uniref:Lipoyl synthase n=1 Tax=Candidatus Ordinivivax streblomastigis TaxID=2540710 RepID=A0A5M8NWS9_9BACT|nr:MAG: Lipoyl synthase [Candidatus Ordinivivax streblomastigis]
MNPQERIRKPEWLRINLGNNTHFATTSKVIKKHCLHTICESGRCPNLGECWNRKTATFMIGGDICTRSCKFCNTKSGKPLPLDLDEPQRVAESIQQLELKHAVLTSVDRDDLPDSGAAHWAQTILKIKEIHPQITMEALIPDFKGNLSHLDTVIQTRPEIISHNIETVARLTPSVRSVAQYWRSLAVLQHISESGLLTKSGLMLGLGETEEEVRQTIHDLYDSGCRLLSIGQYLQPSKKNIAVSAYIHPDVFAEYKKQALSIGFKHVESGPLVRSSYHSIEFLNDFFFDS